MIRCVPAYYPYKCRILKCSILFYCKIYGTDTVTRDVTPGTTLIFSTFETLKNNTDSRGHGRGAGTRYLTRPNRSFVSQYMHVLRHQMILRILTRRHEDSVQSAALRRPEALVAYAQVGDDTWATRGRQAGGQIGRGMGGLQPATPDTSTRGARLAGHQPRGSACISSGP